MVKGIESTNAQHCIRAIAGEVMNLRFMHLIKFCVGGQVIALKSATALILDRCRQCAETVQLDNEVETLK